MMRGCIRETLFLFCASPGSGGQYTGAALNPARVLGPLAVFDCGKDVVGLYIGGQRSRDVDFGGLGLRSCVKLEIQVKPRDRSMEI